MWNPLITVHSGAIQSVAQGLHSLKYQKRFAQCKGFSIPESGKILLVETGILGFRIQNTAHWIWNFTNDWNPESKFHWLRLESEILGLEFSIHCCLRFPYTRRKVLTVIVLTFTVFCLTQRSRIKLTRRGRRRIKSGTKQLFAQN